MSVLALTDISLKELWREVKGEENFWEEFKESTQKTAKRLIETSLEKELGWYVKAERYKRTPERRGYRNGHCQRDIGTIVGTLRDIRAPRLRQGSYPSRVIERYKRRAYTVDKLLLQIFLGGVSTRRTGEIVEILLGDGVSGQTVSEISKVLDEEVKRFRNRRLKDEYVYLILDGIRLKVRGALKVKNRLVLCTYGITKDGRRELISFRQGPQESEAEWSAFLNDLYRRGLWGRI